ncbi:hypothetical protein Tco_0667237 [Tanacetum coccineum]
MIPNLHPHLLKSAIKKPIIVPSSYQPKNTHKPRKAIRTTEISQSSGHINLVADETVYKEWEEKMERAATTASSLDAKKDSGSGPRYQDTILGGADAQTRFETASKQSNDPPLLRGYTLRSGEDSMKLLELMELCIKLLDLATAKIKTVNGERQLQVLVDKKKVIIMETSIISNLHLEDAGGIDCLPTATIFEELARMGAKTTAWNEFSSTMASAIICLATNQKFNLSKYIFDAMSRRKQKKTTAVPHPRDSTAGVLHEEFVPTHSNDPLLSGEDRLKLTDLMDMCTKLSERVLDLEHTKTSQAQEITNLKLRVKKLEKKAGLRTHKFKRLYKVGATRRVEYSDDESLGAQEDASNQERSIEDIDKDAEIYLVDEIQGDQDVIPKEVSTAAPSTTAVSPPVITEVEITLAQTLAKLKSAKCGVDISALFLVVVAPVASLVSCEEDDVVTLSAVGGINANVLTLKIPFNVKSCSLVKDVVVVPSLIIILKQ